MADTNVRIRLTADGSQVRNELRLIDKELADIGNTARQNTNTSNTDNTPTPVPRGNNDNNSNDNRRNDRNTAALVRETSALRTQMQNANTQQSMLTRGLTLLSREMNTLRNQIETLSQIYANPPAQNNNVNTNNNANNNNGHLATIARDVAVIRATSIINQHNQSQGGNSGGGNSRRDSSALNREKPTNINSIMSGFTQAIHTAMRTRSFLQQFLNPDYERQMAAARTYTRIRGVGNDFSGLADRATSLGKPYGFSWHEVLPATNEYQKSAGYGGDASQQHDMRTIMGMSRAFDIDHNRLAGSLGRMTSTGSFELGNQQRFARLLASQIQRNRMEGRESQELEVLEAINSNLANRLPTVSKETMNANLGMYNTFAAINPHLRGERGASLTTKLADIAASGDNALDIYAGLGSKYTGIEGKIALREMAETNQPKYYGSIYSNLKNQFGERRASNELIMQLVDKGMSVSQAKETVKMAQAYDRGENYEPVEGGTAAEAEAAKDNGQALIDENLQHFNDSTAASITEFETNVKTAFENIGKWLWEKFEGLLKDFNVLDSDTQEKLVGGFSALAAGGTGLLGFGLIKKLLPSAASTTSTAAGGGFLSRLVGGLARGGSILGIGYQGITTAMDAVPKWLHDDNRGAISSIFKGLGPTGIGMALGSIIPGVGTLIGGGIGAGVSALDETFGLGIGDWLGDKGGKLYDAYQRGGFGTSTVREEHDEAVGLKGKANLQEQAESNPAEYIKSVLKNPFNMDIASSLGTNYWQNQTPAYMQYDNDITSKWGAAIVNEKTKPENDEPGFFSKLLDAINPFAAKKAEASSIIGKYAAVKAVDSARQGDYRSAAGYADAGITAAEWGGTGFSIGASAASRTPGMRTPAGIAAAGLVTGGIGAYLGWKKGMWQGELFHDAAKEAYDHGQDVASAMTGGNEGKEAHSGFFTQFPIGRKLWELTGGKPTEEKNIFERIIDFFSPSKASAATAPLDATLNVPSQKLDWEGKTERSLRLSDENTRATQENTEAMINLGKAWTTSENGQDDSVQAMFKQRREEQALQKQQEGWKTFFGNMTKNINDTFTSITTALSQKIKSISGGGTNGGIGGKFGGAFDMAKGLSPNASQAEKMKYIMAKLVSKGYSKEAAAAWVGNMVGESSLDPSTFVADDGDGRPSGGLVQWHGKYFEQLQEFASSRGKPWEDIDTQLDFLDHWLKTSEKAGYDRLMRGGSVEELTDYIHRHIERPDASTIPGSAPKRLAGAQQAYGSNFDDYLKSKQPISADSVDSPLASDADYQAIMKTAGQYKGKYWVVQGGNEDTLNGLKPETLLALDMMSKKYYDSTGHPLVLTAGTHGDHPSNGSEFGHDAGWKIDINDWNPGGPGHNPGAITLDNGTIANNPIVNDLWALMNYLHVGFNPEGDHVDVAVGDGDQWSDGRGKLGGLQQAWNDGRLREVLEMLGMIAPSKSPSNVPTAYNPTGTQPNKKIEYGVGNSGYGIKPTYNPHGHGLKYVGSDGYPALLHKGERVLTQQENKELRNISALDVPDEYKITDEDSVTDAYYKHQAQKKIQSLSSSTSSRNGQLTPHFFGDWNEMFNKSKSHFASDYYGQPQSHFFHDLFFNAKGYATGGTAGGASSGGLPEALTVTLTEENYKTYFPKAPSLGIAKIMQTQNKQRLEAKVTTPSGTPTGSTLGETLTGKTPPPPPTTGGTTETTPSVPKNDPKTPPGGFTFGMDNPFDKPKRKSPFGLDVPDILYNPGERNLTKEEAAKAKDVDDPEHLPEYNKIDHGDGTADNPGDSIAVIRAKYNAQRKEMYARLRNQRDGVGSGHEFDDFKTLPGLGDKKSAVFNEETEVKGVRAGGDGEKKSVPGSPSGKGGGASGGGTNPFTKAAITGVISVTPMFPTGQGSQGMTPGGMPRMGNGPLGAVSRQTGGMGAGIPMGAMPGGGMRYGFGGGGMLDLPSRMFAGAQGQQGGGGINPLGLLGVLPGMGKLGRLQNLQGVGGVRPFGGTGRIGERGQSMGRRVGSMLGTAMAQAFGVPGMMLPGAQGRQGGMGMPGMGNNFPYTVGGGFGGGFNGASINGNTGIVGGAAAASRTGGPGQGASGIPGTGQNAGVPKPGDGAKVKTRDGELLGKGKNGKKEIEYDELGNIKGYTGMKDNLITKGDFPLSPVIEAKKKQQRKDMGLDDEDSPETLVSGTSTTKGGKGKKDGKGEGEKNHHGLPGLIDKWGGKDPNSNEHHGFLNRILGRATPYEKEGASAGTGAKGNTKTGGAGARGAAGAGNGGATGGGGGLFGNMFSFTGKTEAKGAGQPGDMLTQVGGMVGAAGGTIGLLGALTKNKKMQKFGAKAGQVGAIGGLLGGIMNLGAAQAGGVGGMSGGAGMEMGGMPNIPVMHALPKVDPTAALGNQSRTAGVLQGETPSGAPGVTPTGDSGQGLAGAGGDGGAKRVEVVVRLEGDPGLWDKITPTNQGALVTTLQSAFTTVNNNS